MENESQHHKAFITYRRAGCACGVVIEAVSRKDATQRLINHLLHPSVANRIADRPEDHADCSIEEWDQTWGVCRDHSVYIHLAERFPAAPEQLELAL